MKTYKSYLVILFLILFISSVRANGNNYRGIDLEEYAFGIPADQLNFNNQSHFTLSFWVNIKEFNHSTLGTQFINVRNPDGDWILCDWGWLVSSIVATGYDDWENVIGNDMLDASVLEPMMSTRTAFKTLKIFKFQPGEWIHASFTYKFTYRPEIAFYINGEQICEYEAKSDYTTLLAWNNEYIIMIGGPAFNRSPLNAYLDKVQFYNKALSQTEIIESMTSPLLNDASLLGYWDFEDGCTTDTEGYMLADNGTIKSAIYKIISNSGISVGTEIQPFVFGMGVDPESVTQGTEDNNIVESNAKVFISNETLIIENAEGINTVVVYDATGKVMTSANVNGATSAQLVLPSTIRGVLIVKVNNEILKVLVDE